jgi:hypothetical protein
MKIYLDLDGVLANFDQRYEQLFGIRPSEAKSRKQHFWNNWSAFVEGGNFASLDWQPGAVDLLSFVASLDVPVEILSSSGGETFHDTVVAQKLKWLESKDIPYKANIVPGGAKKAAFAQPWHILIDDTVHVVENYRNAGGTAILHTNSSDTINQLAALHFEWRARPWVRVAVNDKNSY